jgi:exodeoxyribonuclease-3
LGQTPDNQRARPKARNPTGFNLMRLFSWNVNGLRAVIKKGDLQQFLADFTPDVLCLQETKIDEATLEAAEIRQQFTDYQQFYSFAERKGYSGTAVWVRRGYDVVNFTTSFAKNSSNQPENLSDKYGNLRDEGRLTAVDLGKFYLISTYVPNSKEDLSRLAIREKWDEALKNLLIELHKTKPVVICGDFNVAHNEIDLANPKANRGKHGFTDEERRDFSEFLGEGFHDVFREQNPHLTNAYSWWSHWGQARAKNIGWRIDYFLTSDGLKLGKAEIHPEVIGSDHCPISLEIL